MYTGTQAVVGLFETGFLGHFDIVNPLINLRQLWSNSVNGAPRLMDFNNEGFVFKAQYNGQYFRVPVIHDFTFDPASCRITQMHLYHDPYIVALAFTGRPVPQTPIMPFLTASPPPAQFTVPGVTVQDWQVIPGEEAVCPISAQSMLLLFMFTGNGGG